MKLAFSTLGCPDWNFNEIFATAKDFGFDGVEIRGVKNELYAPFISEFGDRNIGATLEKLARLGVEIPCVTSGICVRNYGLDPAADEGSIKETVEYAELAEKLGAKYVRILGDIDVMPRGDVSDAAVCEAFKVLCGAVRHTKTTLLIETNGAFAESERLAALVKKVNDEKLGVLWDVHHPYRFFKEDLGKTAANIGEYVKYIHVKDSVMLPSGAVKYKMMGKGDVPLGQLIRILGARGYQGFISLEWVKRWCQELEAPGIVFVQYINYMKKVLS